VLAGLAVVLVTVLAALGARSGPWVPATPAATAPTVAGPPALPQTRLPPAVTQSAAPTPSPMPVDSGVLAYGVVAGVLLLVVAAERDLPAGAVGALAERYREARFSTHEVRPEQRDRAREHLLALRAALAEGSPR